MRILHITGAKILIQSEHLHYSRIFWPVGNYKERENVNLKIGNWLIMKLVGHSYHEFRVILPPFPPSPSSLFVSLVPKIRSALKVVDADRILARCRTLGLSK